MYGSLTWRGSYLMPASREQFLIKYQQSIPYVFDSKDNVWFIKEYK